MQLSPSRMLSADPRGSMYTGGPPISLTGFIVRAVILLVVAALVFMQVLNSVLAAQPEASSRSEAALVEQSAVQAAPRYPTAGTATTPV